MFILGNFIYALAGLLSAALTVYWWIVVVKCLISWVNPDPYNQIVMTLNRITEPVLAHIRRRLPFLMMSGIDLSPLLLLFAIQFAQSFIVRSLFDLAVRMK